MTIRIGHCAIRASDIEETARFYREVIGMPEAFRMYTEDGRLAAVHMYVSPYQFIEIFPNGTEPNSRNRQTIGHSHMCYEVENAAAAIEEFRARGAVIDQELKRGGSRCIQFWTHDPDGNSIEFMELPPDCMQVEATDRLNGGSTR